MVLVPEGDLVIGSLGERNPIDPDSKEPQLTAHLAAYWIDMCPVTVGQYQRFCDETQRKTPDPPLWKPPPPPPAWEGIGSTYPMVNVTWEDAVAYAEWTGKQLPNELEWQKAAQGTRGVFYPWGNGWDNTRCANGGNSLRTRMVGQYPSGASPYGCLDMAGNVWEWCADWYDPAAYQRYAKGDLRPPPAGLLRVVRGSSWYGCDQLSFRCDFRYGRSPGLRFNDQGFRCVRRLA
jgi:formylglycine-generating enzyme required for sulfatase activity